MSNILKIRLFLFSLLAITVLFLLYKAIVPFGEITYTWKPCDKSFFISQLKPKDRASGKCQNIIVGEPVYFNLQTQRTFNESDVTIKYKTSDNALKIIELGLQADEQKHYQLKPLENKIIDQLEDWDDITEDGITLLQREKKFDTINDFLQSPLVREEVLTYHYDLPSLSLRGVQNGSGGRQSNPAIEQKTHGIATLRPAPREGLGYARNDIEHTIRPLRGDYQFYTYTEGETMEFEFLFDDLNSNKDKDNIKIFIYNSENVPVATREILDSRGVAEETRQTEDAEGIHLELTTLQPGFYKVVMQTTDDIVTKQIYSSQEIMSFINKIRLADTAEENLITVYTDVSQVGIGTMNPTGLQKVLINDKVLNITETYKTFHQPTNSQISKIQFAKDDLIISGSGVFSFSPEALYNPDYKKMTSNSSLEGVNYIITTYPPTASQLGGQVLPKQEQMIKFDLHNMYREDNAYGFIFSIPGLLHNDSVDDQVEIEEIKIKLKGRTLWEKLKK
ncbi:MAG: hypothetical protein ABIH48_02495 [Candidatus Falkowbacteria bacterium]